MYWNKSPIFIATQRFIQFAKINIGFIGKAGGLKAIFFFIQPIVGPFVHKSNKMREKFIGTCDSNTKPLRRSLDRRYTEIEMSPLKTVTPFQNPS